MAKKANTKPRIVLICDHGKLVPTDTESEQALSKIHHGTEVWAELKRVVDHRNVLWHRKFFKMLHLVYDHALPDAMQERYPTFEKFRKGLMIYLGFYETYEMPDGRVVIEAESMSFENMGQERFEQLWKEAVEVICTKIVPGLSSYDLEMEINHMAA